MLIETVKRKRPRGPSATVNVFQCDYCRRQYEKSSNVPRGHHDFCSVKCSNKSGIRRARRLTLTQRFLAKIRSTNGCWVWGGTLRQDGYGGFGVRENGKTRNKIAHRVSWELHNGSIPEGMFVLHKCDNRPCVNPEHLFLGTQIDNMRDMYAKGRNANQFGRGFNAKRI